MYEPVEEEGAMVEDVGGQRYTALVDADLPPIHDAKDAIQPATGEEVDWIETAEETSEDVYNVVV